MGCAVLTSFRNNLGKKNICVVKLSYFLSFYKTRKVISLREGLESGSKSVSLIVKFLILINGLFRLGV